MNDRSIKKKAVAGVGSKRTRSMVRSSGQLDKLNKDVQDIFRVSYDTKPKANKSKKCKNDFGIPISYESDQYDPEDILIVKQLFDEIVDYPV